MTGQAPGPTDPVPPQGLDVTVPNVARIYDHLLGGKDNFEADREAARQLLAAVPDTARAARANRAFLARSVQFLAREAGTWHFLDIGTGLPTRGNVHEIAQIPNPQAHVLYCDIDPMVVVHANAPLANSLTVAATRADLRQPDRLFTMPVTRTLIDTSEPSRWPAGCRNSMSELADIDDRQLAWGHVALHRRATAATHRRTRRAPARNARRRKREGIGTCAAHRGQPQAPRPPLRRPSRPETGTRTLLTQE